MAYFIRCLRPHVSTSVRHYLVLSRPIMTSPFLFGQALEDLKSNPHYEKYAHKIDLMKRTSPDELHSRLEKIHIEKTKPAETTSGEGSKFSVVAEPKSECRDNLLCTKQKLLSDIMKTELIIDKTSDEIKKIWEEYHKHKDVIAATLSPELYGKVVQMSKQFPLFLFPLPRDQGYEFFLCQFSGNEVHFTPLVNYQAHKENAPECLTMVHYPEMKDDKGIILMLGEYNKDIINAKEALCLANQLQLYYCQADDKRLQLMERFSFQPDEFQHMDLIAELETLTTSFYLK